jgi:hypothetical protein
MKKAIITVLLILLPLSLSGVCAAKSYRVELSAGGSSLYGSFDSKFYVNRGYLKTGFSGVYADNGDENYKIGNLKFSVGSETLSPGLQCDLGFKGLIGQAEERDEKGDLGAIGFMGAVYYILPHRISPIPIELSLELTAAPKPLAILDLDNYFDVKTGIGFFIVENAAISLSYRHYSIGMEKNGTSFDVNDDTFMIGLELQF